MSKQPLKNCQGCGELKPHTPEYFVRQRGKLTNLCKLCNRARSKASEERRKSGLISRPTPAPEGMKFCSGCNEYKPATEDHFHRHSRYGFQSECRECLKRKNRDAYRVDPEPRQERNRNAYWKRQGKDTPIEKLPGKKPKVRRPAETRLEKEIVAFLEARKNLAPGSLKTYERYLFQFAQAHPEFPPRPQGVTDFLADGGWNENSKRHIFIRMRVFVNWLRKTRRVKGDPLEGIVRPRKVDLLPQAPKRSDIQKVFDYLEYKVVQRLKVDTLEAYRAVKDLAAFSLMLDSGLRVGEVCGLNVDDIDLDEMSAFISRSKTGRQRYVAFGKQVRGNLRLWLKIRAELGIPDRLKALFVSERGGWRRCDTSSFANSLKNHCQAAGAKPFSPHKLRHAHATQAIKLGQNIAELQAQMGHRDIKMTARYFLLPSEGRQLSHLKTSPLDHLGGAI